MSRKSATGSFSDVVSVVVIAKLCEVTSVKWSKPIEVLSSASIQVARSVAPNLKIILMILKEKYVPSPRAVTLGEIHGIVK